MTKYHNPQTKKTVEAENKREALQKMAPKAVKKPAAKKSSPKVSKADKAEEKE